MISYIPYEQLLNAELRKHSVKYHEFSVLEATFLRLGTDPPQRLLEVIMALWNDDDSPIRIYEEAIHSCLVKEWLQIVDFDYCTQDKLRWENDENQTFSEYELEPGDLEFTELGANLYDEIVVAIEIQMGRRPHENLWAWTYRYPGQALLIGLYEEDVSKRLSATPDDNDYVFSSIQEDEISVVTERKGPFTIQNWWATRFIQLEKGYKGIIYYHNEPKA